MAFPENGVPIPRGQRRAEVPKSAAAKAASPNGSHWIPWNDPGENPQNLPSGYD